MSDYLLGCDVLGSDVVVRGDLVGGSSIIGNDDRHRLGDHHVNHPRVGAHHAEHITGGGGGGGHGGGGGGHGGGGGGHGGGGGGHGGGGHGGGHHGGGPRPGPAWWGGGGPWGYWGGPDYYDIVEDVDTLRCIKYDASGKCLEYAPTDILGDGTDTDFNAPAYVVEDPSSDFYQPAYVIGKTGAVVGLFDLGSETKKMQALRPVTVEIAHLLVKYGQQVIAEAIATANQPWYKPDLPGKTSRAEVAEHLQWHVDNLTKYADQLALYPSGDDLKAWALRSFIESNSVEAGNARMGAAWVALWAEIRDALARIPKETLKALGGAAGGLAEGVLGMPVWAIGLGAVAAVALAGTLAYTLRR